MSATREGTAQDQSARRTQNQAEDVALIGNILRETWADLWDGFARHSDDERQPTERQEALLLCRYLRPGQPEEARRAHRILSEGIQAELRCLGRCEFQLLQVVEALASYLDTSGFMFEEGEWVAVDRYIERTRGPAAAEAFRRDVSLKGPSEGPEPAAPPATVEHAASVLDKRVWEEIHRIESLARHFIESVPSQELADADDELETLAAVFQVRISQLAHPTSELTALVERCRHLLHRRLRAHLEAGCQIDPKEVELANACFNYVDVLHVTGLAPRRVS